MTATSTARPKTETLEVPGRHADLRRPAQRREHRAGPAADRLADGRRRLRHPLRPLHRPHRRHLRPAGERAQRHDRSRQPGDARGPRRRPAPAHRRRRGRAGRPVRQQRRRGERAGPRGEAPAGRTDARRARAAPRLDPPRPGARPRRGPGRPRDVPTRRLGRRDGALHRRHGHQGPFTAESAGQPAPDPATFGLPAEDDGSRADPLLGQNIITGTHYEPDFDALRAAPTRIVWPPGRSPGASWRAVALPPSPSGSAPRRCSSPATTAGSSVASTARRATQMPSPPCAGCSSGPDTAEPPPGQGNPASGPPPAPGVGLARLSERGLWACGGAGNGGG